MSVNEGADDSVRREMLMKCAATAMSSKLIHQVRFSRGLRLGPVLADIDNFPRLALALRSPIDAMPIYLEMLDHAIFHDWYHFFSYLLKHLRKTYLNAAETEPG